MIHTPLCDLLSIQHPVILGGMGTATSPELVAAVSNAGGLGVLGCSGRSAEAIHRAAAEIRRLTDRPFGLNFLLCFLDEQAFVAALEERPPVMALAWGDPTDATRRAREAGCRVMMMVPTAREAERAARAGADVIVAQGTEAGGHAGHVATLPLVPQVVDVVGDVPVVAAGGIVDGRGLAAALALGAQGVLMGTRFLATEEAPIHQAWKQKILEAADDSTVFTEVYEIATERVWPGAWGRAIRNRFTDEWHGREAEVRQHVAWMKPAIAEARATGDPDLMPLWAGQGVGLVREILPAGQVVRRMVEEAEQALARLCQLHGGVAL